MTPEIFTKDWFDGRTIDAISADDSKRIGWEDEITNYSEFLFNQNYIDRLINDKELIIEELNKVLEAMNVDANVGFSNKANTAYTDGSNIVIDTKFVPDNSIKNINKIYSKFDVLIGLLIHEACHCKYTDFEYCEKNRNLLNPIIHSIHNILEDECIERNIGLGFPGYSNFIKAVKLELFKRQMNKKTLTWNIDDLQDIFNLLLITVRYPEKLKIVPKEVLEQHSELFEKIKNVLDFKGILERAENFSCTRDTVSAAIAIFNLLDINECDMSISLNIPGMIGNGEKKSDSSSDSENNSSNNKYKSNGRRSMGDALNSLENSALNAEDKDNINSKSETVSREQEKQILNEITQEYGDADKENVNTRFNPFVTSFNGKIIKQKKSNKLLYNRIYGRISKYVKDFKKMIIPQGTNEEYRKLDFQRSGQLDPNQLINALTGGRFVNTRMQKHIIDNVPKYAFVINIDEGSSMAARCVHNCEHRHKSTTHNEMANELSILIYEALSKCPGIQLYIYGSGNEVHKYIDPKHLDSKYTLTARNLQSGKDYLSTTIAVVEDVRKQTGLPIVLLNITDSFYKVENTFKTFNEKLSKLKAMAIMINVCTWNNLKINNCPNEELIKFNNELYGEDGWIQNTKDDTFEELAEHLANAIKSKYRKLKRH